MAARCGFSENLKKSQENRASFGAFLNVFRDLATFD